MVIALDYDETFSRAPESWFAAMLALKGAGHAIIGVTLRNQAQVIEDPRYFEICDSVVYCAGRAKKPLLDDVLDIPIDVWIDDNPIYIVQSWEERHGRPFMNYDPNAWYMVPTVVET